ncbi:hypothetical protein ABIA30_001234 [Mycobacterium sp. MAA66]|uniref:lipase family protein n=1 Tax=Mycobacterium sp. MAA66 TaxID=3156297 RepID=UPI003515F6BA
MNALPRIAAALLAASVTLVSVACGTVPPPVSGHPSAPVDRAGALVHAGPMDSDPQYTATDVRAQSYRYRSVTPAGDLIDVEARLYLPQGHAPPGGWPLAAYAHGTTGVIQSCAPTGSDPLIAELLSRGVAVAATNYQGLGGPGRHPYLDSGSQARDVLYAARAARAARDDLSNRIVLVGLSQGGRASEAAASLTELTPELHILGNAMASPALRLDFVAGIENKTLTAVQLGILPFIVYGAQQHYPAFQYSSVLRGELLKDAPAIANTCASEIVTKFASLLGQVTAADTQFVSEAAKTDLAKYLADGNLPWRAHTSIPVMITRGDHDSLVSTQWTDVAVKAMCAAHTTLYDQLRPGDHTDHPEIDIARVGSWVADRFARKLAPDNCPR